MIPCPTVPSVIVPGPPASDGINTATVLTAPLTLPAQLATVIASVLNCQWMAVGQSLLVNDGINVATFRVAGAPTTPFDAISLQFLQYLTDSPPGTVIASGAIISPTGPEPIFSIPIPIAQGGTAATIAPTAHSNLGLTTPGPNSDITSLTGLTTPLSLNQGGTGSPTPSTARTALRIQAGKASLVYSGITAAISANIYPTTKILISLVTPSGTRTNFSGYAVEGTTYGIPGTFYIAAINSSNPAGYLTSCADTVAYMIIG